MKRSDVAESATSDVLHKMLQINIKFYMCLSFAFKNMLIKPGFHMVVSVVSVVSVVRKKFIGQI